MSRLSSLSPAALKAMFARDSDDTLITLLTFTGGGIGSPIRVADGYTARISTTADEIVYGVPSRGNDFTFIPFQIILPDEQVASAPQCTITLYDVTRQLMPAIRALSGPPTGLIELVLASTPNTVEIAFSGFELGSVPYSAEQITLVLGVQSLAAEPFPAHGFTPSYFPGLF